MPAVPELLLKPKALFDTPVTLRFDWNRMEAELNEVLRDYSDRFVRMIEPVQARTSPYAAELAAVKRFGERWRADIKFRELLPKDPVAVARQYGLEADPMMMRALWDPAYCAVQPADWQPPLAIQRYRLFVREKLLHREALRTRECVPADPRHRAWRERQIARTMTHLGPRNYDGIIHAPFAIEVSQGCSVGCWFCGVSAERKKTDFLYTPENARLWQSVLGTLSRQLGTAAATGFTYWATDPLDNPDYEKLCIDMADICGRFPQTTTAQPQKHVERVHQLLRLSEDRGCTINRFSVLTLKHFDKVMESFSAEELLHCEIVAQNLEASHIQGNAGRARGARKLAKSAEAHGLTEAKQWAEVPGTIACVSGWLINMVEQRVRLITPCPASDRWPDGYWVLDDRHFHDGEEFEAQLEDMMERHMTTTLKASHPARLRADLKVSCDGKAIRAEGYGAHITVSGAAHLQELTNVLLSGKMTVGELALWYEDSYGYPAANVMHTLNKIFDTGSIDEEPRTTTRTVHTLTPVFDAAPAEEESRV
jgi:radical SAM family RiPP maturation amino acid epimerase